MSSTAYRSILGILPKPVSASLRRGFNQLRPTETESSPETSPVSDPKNPVHFAEPSTLSAVYERLAYYPFTFLEMRFARQAIAADRARNLIKTVKRFDGASAAIAHNTIGYNLTAFEPGSDPVMERPMLLVSAVCSIDKLLHNRADLAVLVIGPRSENEMFGLFAAGFSPEKTRGLDLFSYSPFIDVGDMHALPYPDDSFDVVIHSFALTYSKDQNLAAREMIRVARNRAIIAVGDEYKDESSNENRKRTFRDEATYTNDCAHIAGLFQGHVRRIFISHEPDPPESVVVMSVLELQK